MVSDADIWKSAWSILKGPGVCVCPNDTAIELYSKDKCSEAIELNT